MFVPAATPGQGVEWIRQFGSPDNDVVNDVGAAADGCIYSVGYTNGAIPGQTEVGNRDAFVRKYDPDGSEIWTWQFGTVEAPLRHVQASGVAVGSDGRIYVAGNTSGTLPGQTRVGEDHDDTDAFLRKYDPDGNEIWTRQFGSIRSELVYGVAVDSDRTAYVVGSTSGALPGQTRVGGQDVFITKCDTDGSLIWFRQFGTAGSDRAQAVGVDSDGNAYVAGVLNGGTVSMGWGDIFLRKYDSDGAEIWTRNFDTPETGWVGGVSVDADDNPYVAGSVQGTLPGQTRTGTRDAFLRKYDPDGSETWTRQFGAGMGTVGYGVAVDLSSYIWVGGSTWGFPFPDHSSAGGMDIFVRKYDAAGRDLWTCQFGSPGDEIVDGLDVDSSGSAYPCGYTRGALPGQTYEGEHDAFLAKFLPGCAILPAAIALPSSVCPGEDAVLDASATAGQPCGPTVIEYAWTETPNPPPPGAQCGPGQVLDCWDWDNDTLALTNLIPDPAGGIVTRWLWVRPRGEPDCVNTEPYPVTVEVLPDPLPSATGNGFCLEREDDAILFRWDLLPGDVGGYEVLELDGDIGSPTPAAFEAVPAPLAVAGTLETEVSVSGSAVLPSHLVFFKLRATSPCTGTPGPACDGFAAQVPCQ